MNSKNLIIAGFLFFIGVITFSCKKEEQKCLCETYEECIDEVCVLKENVYLLGGEPIIGGNQYIGIVKDNPCVDTLVFIDLPTNLLGGFVFLTKYLVLRGSTGGVIKIHEYGENDYLFGSGSAVCATNGKLTYADFRCKIEPDSTLMNMYFFEIGTNAYTDTIDLVLYRNW